MKSPVTILPIAPVCSAQWIAGSSLPDNPDLEMRLTQFIRWSLRQSQSGSYSPHQSMQWLNCAWEAQKQLWQLRKQQIEVEMGTPDLP
jgi:hypothetical protein